MGWLENSLSLFITQNEKRIITCQRVQQPWNKVIEYTKTISEQNVPILRCLGMVAITGRWTCLINNLSNLFCGSCLGWTLSIATCQVVNWIFVHSDLLHYLIRKILYARACVCLLVCVCLFFCFFRVCLRTGFTKFGIRSP